MLAHVHSVGSHDTSPAHQGLGANVSLEQFSVGDLIGSLHNAEATKNKTTLGPRTKTNFAKKNCIVFYSVFY